MRKVLQSGRRESERRERERRRGGKAIIVMITLVLLFAVLVNREYTSTCSQILIGKTHTITKHNYFVHKH